MYPLPSTRYSELSFHFDAYVAEFRQFCGYDDGLRSGAYNFGFLDKPDLGNCVERFQYQDGLLISYWDSSQSNKFCLVVFTQCIDSRG